MEQVKSAFDAVIGILWQFLAYIMGGIGTVDQWLRTTMTQFGVPQSAQSIIVILAALLLFILAFKVLSGLLRVLLIVFLMLLVAQALGPVGNGPRRVEVQATLLG